MGYYANYGGRIETKPMSQQDVKRFLAAIDSEEITGLLTEAPTPYAFEQWEVCEIFKVRKFLNAIAPYTKSGEIEYNGEDNTLWRFAFRDGEWYDDRGYVSYIDSVVPISVSKEGE